MIIFNTDTLTEFSYGNENVRRNIEENADEQLAVTVVTWHEALRGRAESLLKAADGVQLLKAMDRFLKTEEQLKSFIILPFDDIAASHFDRLRNQPKLETGRADMLIACIVLARKALLVTRNLKENKGIAGLRLQDWTK